MFAYKTSDVSIEGCTITALGCDWEKDSFSLITVRDAVYHIRWEVNGSKIWLITDCRPQEASDRVPTTDLYAIAFNTDTYRFTSYPNGEKKTADRNPTEVEKYIAQSIVELESAQMQGAINCIDIRLLAIRNAVLASSPTMVFNLASVQPGLNGAPSWFTKEIAFAERRTDKRSYSPPKSFSELAEEKLRWLESLDAERVKGIAESLLALNDPTQMTPISAEDIILTILRVNQ